MNTRGLDRALNALSPYLDDLVICGAWAWYLYRRCLAPGNPIVPVFTRDLDCIGRERIPLHDPTLRAALDDSGFVWIPRGDDSPPAAKFVWPDASRAEVEIEFLVPARGDGSRATHEIHPRVAAQALRDLEILVDRPISVLVDARSPLAPEIDFRGRVRLPRMGHFVIQKGLIHRHRTREQQIKDFVYVFDLLDSLNDLADDVLRDVVAARGRWARAVDEFCRLVERKLGDRHFMEQIAGQVPVERGATPRYIGTEAAEWLERLRSTA